MDAIDSFVTERFSFFKLKVLSKAVSWFYCELISSANCCRVKALQSGAYPFNFGLREAYFSSTVFLVIGEEGSAIYFNGIVSRFLVFFIHPMQAV
jgi:hypothetical protein